MQLGTDPPWIPYYVFKKICLYTSKSLEQVKLDKPSTALWIDDLSLQ